MSIHASASPATQRSAPTNPATAATDGFGDPSTRQSPNVRLSRRNALVLPLWESPPLDLATHEEPAEQDVATLPETYMFTRSLCLRERPSPKPKRR